MFAPAWRAAIRSGRRGVNGTTRLAAARLCVGHRSGRGAPGAGDPFGRRHGGTLARGTPAIGREGPPGALLLATGAILLRVLVTRSDGPLVRASAHEIRDLLRAATPQTVGSR